MHWPRVLQRSLHTHAVYLQPLTCHRHSIFWSALMYALSLWLSMTLELCYHCLSLSAISPSLSVFSLCWSSLGTPHFLLTLVPNLTSPMSLLDQPPLRGISWIWDFAPAPPHQCLPLLPYLSFMLALSFCHLSKKQKQNGEPAPSPCLSLGSWVRVFTHLFVLPVPPPRTTAISCRKSFKGKQINQISMNAYRLMFQKWLP